MTEQLKHSTIDQYSHKPETDNDNKNKIYLNRKGRLARAGAIALSTIGLTTAAVSGGAEIFKETPVATVTETIDSGETPIGAVTDGVMQIAEEHNISPNTIYDTVYAGQKVADELGQPVQAGAKIEVTIVKNGLGQHTAKASPTSPDNLAHLND